MAKKRALALIGGEWHPWESCADILKQFVEDSGRWSVDITTDRNALKAASLRLYDALIVYAQGGELSKPQLDGMLGLVKGGGGLVALHSAAASFRKHPEYIEMIGGEFAKHGPVTEFPVNIVKDHQITRRMPSFRIVDEFYILDKFTPENVEVLASGYWHDVHHPLAYTKPYGKGRVYFLGLGHDERAFCHPEFQKLLLRGLDWTVGRAEGKPLKVGCIGYGQSFKMGRLHLTSLQKAGCTPVAICDLDQKCLEIAKSEWPRVETYRSSAQMLKKSDIELVVVITPHNSHAKLAVQCLEAGRHVVTEKPFCITVKEADLMIAAAKKAKRLLSVFHNRRWDGDYMTLREIVRQGLIGEVFQVEAFMGGYGHPSYWWRSHKPISGGAFYDWGAHICDWVLGLAGGKMTEITGVFQKDRVWHDVTNEEHCTALVRFDNGVSASIEWSHIAAAGKKRWRVLGTKGAIEDGPEGSNSFHVVSYRDGVKMDMHIPWKESLWDAYYRNVIDHLLLGELLSVTPESARRVIALIETAERSSREGKSLAPPKHCV